MSELLKEANIIYTRARYVRCPHCDAQVDGWVSDPRGVETTCDECKKPFKVSTIADVRIE